MRGCNLADGGVIYSGEITHYTTRRDIMAERTIVNPWTWQDNFGFVQGLDISGGQRVLMCAGQTSNDADGNPLHAGDMTGQINQSLDNLETVLNQAGLKLSDVARLNIYTTDVDQFLGAAEVYGKRLAEGGCRPAATLLGVTRLWHPDILVELEATAVV